MTLGQIFALVGHTGASFQKNGVVDANGNLVKHPALMEVGELATVVGDVVTELKADGVPVPAQLEKYIKAAPEILGLIATVAG
ncbi:MAG TPA: hypothetical protein VFV60_04205, partial [bacterium]|nr:hypothetical protein [bacterium]